VFPRRILFLVAVLAGALAAGAALAYLLHMMSPVVSSARSLAEFTGLPVLGVVSGAFPGRFAQQARSSLLHFAVGVACLVGAFMIAIALNWSGFRLGAAALQAG
jgi:hypothetical protein